MGHSSNGNRHRNPQMVSPEFHPNQFLPPHATRRPTIPTTRPRMFRPRRRRRRIAEVGITNAAACAAALLAMGPNVFGFAFAWAGWADFFSFFLLVREVGNVVEPTGRGSQLEGTPSFGWFIQVCPSFPAEHQQVVRGFSGRRLSRGPSISLFGSSA